MSSRAQSHRYRPFVHYSPASNWMNDPNGLVYFDGEWHLFYQHYPYESKAKNIHWGHAVSDNLITWTELPIALTPDDEFVGIWSGSAVIDWKNVTGFQREKTIPPMIAVYTWQRRGWQEQHMSYSLDRGRTWIKYPSNPIIPLTRNLSFSDQIDLNPSEIVFRDPKLIYHPSSNSWIALISGGDHIQFHRSVDLIHWSLVSRFGTNDGSHAGVWECPDLIDFSSKEKDNQGNLWILIVSIDRNAVAGGSGTQYFIGTFDGYTFNNLQSPSQINWLDYGPDYYAAISYHNIPHYDHRQIMIGWMNNWLYGQDLPTGPLWRGQMSIPRQLELDYNSQRSIYQLRQKPVRELFSRRTKLFTYRQEILKSNSSNFLSNIFGEVYFLSSQFHSINSRTKLHFYLRRNSNRTEYTRISYIGEKNQIQLDRSHSGNIDFHPLFRTDFNVTLNDEILSTGVLNIEILVDRCSVELFLNDGVVTMTSLIFPNQSSDGIELSLENDENIQIDHLELILFEEK